MAQANELYFRLATSEAGLARGYLFLQGIPAPQPEYKDYSYKASHSDGGEARHGYKTVTLLWSELDPAAGHKLRKLVEDANGTIYATILRGDGKKGGWDFIDISGIPLIPDMAPAASLSGASWWMYTNVQLIIRNVTILNEPAEFT